MDLGVTLKFTYSMTNKIHCPYHADDTPSMNIYPDHAYCFGCGKKVSLEELEALHPISPKSRPNPFTRNRLQKENIENTIKRLYSLQKKEIRGVDMPYDESGYYIIYPGAKYYVKRLWDGLSSNKYRSPYGHGKVLFIKEQGLVKDTLLIIEGQMNALSALEVTDLSVCSPGSANDLTNSKFLPVYLQYSKFCIIVDRDAPGVINALRLQDALVKSGKRVAIHAVSEDLNKLLVEHGKERVRVEIKEALAMLGV